MIPVLRTVAALRAQAAGWRAEGRAIGLVPTMGALHEGHASLAARARADCARVVVTVFVNPAQFESPEDLARYPRTEEADAALLAPLGVDALFAPASAEVYPPGFATRIAVGGPAAPMEGAHRPGHFDAVATVVAKLFGMVQADRAYFGEKDWQQLAVVRRMAADLNLATEVVGCPTVRAPDGLALSSRNARLDAAARARAPALFAALTAAAGAIGRGVDPAAATGAARAAVTAAGFDAVDYLEHRDAADLGPARADAPSRLFAAARIGGVRLIDNVPAPRNPPGPPALSG